MRIRIIAVFICLSSLTLCLTGCVVTKVHTMPVENISSNYDQVWDNIIKYLSRDKEPILAMDKDKGIIATDWVNMQKVFSVKRYRYDIQMRRISDNEIQVGIASPQETYSMGDWEEALPNERRAQKIFSYLREKSGKIVKFAKRPLNRRTTGLVGEEGKK